MSDLVVKIGVLNQTISDMNSYKTSVASQISQVEYIKNNLSFKVKNQAAINADLNSLINELKLEKTYITAIESRMREIVAKYKLYESKITSNMGKSVSKASFKDVTGDSLGNFDDIVKETYSQDNVETPDIDWSVIWKFVSEAGIIGSIVGGAGEFITASDETTAETVEKWLKLVKSGNTVFEKIVKASGKADWTDDLFGLQKNTAKSFVDSIDDSLSSYNVQENAKIGISKWLGAALTLGVNACENYDEFGGVTARGVAETVVETGIDIGKNIVLSAAVTAALGAGTPAMVVGGVAVGIGWGLDKISEKVTGKKLTEFVSDSIIDNAERKIENAKIAVKVTADIANKAANKTMEVANQVGEAVGEATEKLGNAIENGVKNVGNAVMGAAGNLTASWKKAFAW